MYNTLAFYIGTNQKVSFLIKLILAFFLRGGILLNHFLLGKTAENGAVASVPTVDSAEAKMQDPPTPEPVEPAEAARNELQQSDQPSPEERVSFGIDLSSPSNDMSRHQQQTESTVVPEAVDGSNSFVSVPTDNSFDNAKVQAGFDSVSPPMVQPTLSVVNNNNATNDNFSNLSIELLSNHGKHVHNCIDVFGFYSFYVLLKNFLFFQDLKT